MTTPADEVAKSLYSIAKERHSVLANLLEMSEEEYKNTTCGRNDWTIAEALGVSESDLPDKTKNL